MADTQDAEFIGSPDNYMLGVFDETGHAERAFQELTEAGFAEDQVLLCVPPESLDSTGSEHGPLARIERAVQHLLTNKSHLAEYEHAAEQGACVLGVHAEEDEQRREAQSIFERHRARNVNYFGKWVVETLSDGPADR
jgi:hypothetical protein